MPRARLAAIVTVALVVAAAGCRRGEPPPAGNIAAALAATHTLDGAPFDPARLANRPAIVVFWRTGCSHCLKEMPIIARVARAHGVPAVAVMVAGSPRKAEELAATFDGTIVVDGDGGPLRTAYEITKVPYTLVLRADGSAARAFIGEQSESTFSDALADVR